MKTFLFLILMFPLYLFSNDGSINVDLQYKEAVKSYKEKDFKNSYEIFSKIYLSKLSDVNLNFYFGRSAFETGNYEAALAAFERVEMLDSTNINNKLQMGLN
ncbi:hypothetical protein [Sulfurimonas sp.]|uniref:hypothetical protein n=1 Tax=Sulfurimonas sp. TaxID=2022749 RepID=UPI0025DA1BE7|nr:hypothetical protein [Sulfurimonas sp.]